MSHWETPGRSDEWYTPKYVFEALGVTFDIDVAAPYAFKRTHVPARYFFIEQGLERVWEPTAFVWMNPPFGGRNGLKPWLDKFFEHGNGIALVPDRTSAPWWQSAARQADRILFVSPKIKFEQPDGTTGRSPSTGTALFASGGKAEFALHRASKNGLGLLCAALS